MNVADRHTDTAVNIIYGHMDAKTQTYMEDIVRMNVTDRQVYKKK